MPHYCELLGMDYDAWQSAPNKINGFLCLVIAWIFFAYLLSLSSSSFGQNSSISKGEVKVKFYLTIVL